MSPSKGEKSPNFCPPPPRFFPAGNVIWAEFANNAPHFIDLAKQKKKPRGKKGDGIRYEQKVQEYLCSCSPGYIPAPWLHYRRHGITRPRWVQPDGINFNLEKGLITIVECKLSHTANAWWQTRKLYEPVLRSIFPQFDFNILEIVKWFDPSTPFPEHFTFAPEPFTSPADSFAVHIFSDRRG